MRPTELENNYRLLRGLETLLRLADGELKIINHVADRAAAMYDAAVARPSSDAEFMRQALNVMIAAQMMADNLRFEDANDTRTE